MAIDFWYNYNWTFSSQAAESSLSMYVSLSAMWWPVSSKLNGVCVVGIPDAIVVKLWVSGAQVLGALRSHSARQVFWTLKFDCHCDFRSNFLSAKVPGKAKLVVIGGHGWSFSCCFRGNFTQKDTFGGIKYARWWEAEWRSQHCRWALPKNHLPIWDLLLFRDVQWYLRLHFRS